MVLVPQGKHLQRGACWNRCQEETVKSLCCSRISGSPHDPCGRSMLEFLKDCTTWEGPTLEQFMRNYSLMLSFMQGLMLRSSWKIVFHGRDPTLEQRKEEEWVMNWTQLPFSVHLWHCRGGVIEIMIEVEPRKKGGVEVRCGRKVFKCWLLLSHYSCLIGNKLN